jgi:subtilisin family serine protease
MNVINAWKRGYSGKGVVVSILDDGIQRDHPDLALNYVSCGFMCTLGRGVIINSLPDVL